MQVPPFSLSQQLADLGPALDDAVLRVLHSGQYIGGAEIQRFEESFAASAHCPFAVGCNSGTDALILALGFDIYKIDPQAKVSVSSEGFCKLSTHVRQLGLPTLIVQEGGYDLDALSENVQQFFRGLEG